MKEARHYLKLGRNVQCKVCPNNCLLKPGDRSHCRNKVNRDGALYTLVYGNPCTFHVDPVEKKPLFHFLPGTLSFSLATSGCVFRCLNCQNWEISQKKPEETKDPRGEELRLQPPLPSGITLEQMARLSLFPEDVVAVAEALGCPSISYTYSEPTAFYEYTQDTCKAARGRKLKNIVVTCGSIEERPARDLYQFADAAHVDLKGFDEAIYKKLNAGKLSAILATIKTLNDLGVWFEIINLIVPTYTDNLDAIRRMCGWIVKELGPDRPLHFSRFHPAHKLDSPDTHARRNAGQGPRRRPRRGTALRLYRQRARPRRRGDDLVSQLPESRRRTRHLRRHAPGHHRRQMPLLRDEDCGSVGIAFSWNSLSNAFYLWQPP